MLLCFFFSFVFARDILVYSPCGPIRGVSAQNGTIDAFLGVPFARACRWCSPVPVAPWTTVFNATSFGKSCPQPSLPLSELSEDCLWLNLWRRRKQNHSSSSSVLVWIYGGGFISGRASDPLLEGKLITEQQDVIVVSFNYRLGPLGWIGGNLGFEDQLLAFKWVNKNIAAFGGDSTKVTIYGQSAGAISVMAHYTSPDSWPYFSRAIAQSPVPGLVFRSPEIAADYAKAFGVLLGCGGQNRDCWNRASLESIIKAGGSAEVGLPVFHHVTETFLHWGPIVDNVTIFGSPLNLIRLGKGGVLDNRKQNSSFSFVVGRPNTPLLIGTTANETVASLPLFKATKLELEALLTYWFGSISHVKQVIDKYNNSNFEEAAFQIMSDVLFHCPIQEIALHTGARLYQFIHAPWNDPFNSGHPLCNNFSFSCHACDLNFVFQSFNMNPKINMTADERLLSDQVQQIWGSFSKGGLDFNWPRFENASRISLSIVTSGPKFVSFWRYGFCQVLESFLNPPKK